MSKIFIYRVEHITSGVGPYNCRQNDTCRRVIKRLNKSHANGKSNNHQAWGADGILNRIYIDYNIDSTHFKSGFTSLDDLYTWFAGHLSMLLSNQFRIKSYIVEDRFIIKGKNCKQVAFYLP